MRIVVLLCSWLFWFAHAHAGTGDFANVAFVDAHDGDTFNVNIDGLPDLFGKKIPVRVRGIDAPEISDKQKCPNELAKLSRCYLRHILSAKGAIIDLRYPSRDKYFRIVASVYVNGKSVTDIMLNFDLAVPYSGDEKTFSAWCPLLSKAKGHSEVTAACR